jgi:hypothetical protein
VRAVWIQPAHALGRGLQPNAQPSQRRFSRVAHRRGLRTAMLVAILSALVFCSAVLSMLLKNQNIRTAQRQQYTGTSTYSNAVATTNSSGSGFCGGKNATITLPNCDPNSPTSNTVFDTTAPNTSAYTTVTVNAGGDLQTAINNASCNPNGTIISVAAGATFNTGRGSPNYATGPYDLPAKTCAAGQWIIIQSSAIASLPASGTRVDPTMAANMPNIQATAGIPAITVRNGANHYWFIGIQFSAPANTDTINLIDLFAGDTTGVYSPYPDHFVFDRCYIHGNNELAHEYRRGLYANMNFLAILSSYVAQFHSTGADSQTILMDSSNTGPLKVINSYLSASGENFMSGGGGSGANVGTPPHDFEFRQNHFYKPLTWFNGGQSKIIVTKDLFELKNAQRVLLDGNVLEYSWLSGQIGFGLIFTPANVQDGPNARVDDVTFTHNIFRHTANGMQFGGDAIGVRRMFFQNNIWQDMANATWGDNTSGWVIFETLSGNGSVFDHNTMFETGSSESAPIVFSANGVGGSINPWQYTNNLVNRGALGVIDVSRGFSEGNPTLNSYVPNKVWNQNVLINSTSLASIYPTGTLWTTPDSTAVGFTDNTNCAGGTFTASACQLISTSPYHSAGTDRKDIGADINSINSATAGVIQVHD